MAIASGIIAGAAALGGSILGAKAQKKAAKTAAQAQIDATAQNNQLAREQYAKNAAVLSPWQVRGNAAGQAVNALLGIPIANGNGSSSALATAQQNAAYQNAFAKYRGSTGYQFRQNEGMRALDNSFASKGVGQSGAAAKAAIQFGQNIGSAEFANYLGQLGGVSAQGLSAANAQAGVGTNLVNSITANNNASAGAIGNSALAAGNANAQLWGAAGNALGNIGSIFASSFGNSGTNALGNGAFSLKNSFKI